jgi:hypothetical protein
MTDGAGRIHSYRTASSSGGGVACMEISGVILRRKRIGVAVDRRGSSGTF